MKQVKKLSVKSNGLNKHIYWVDGRVLIVITICDLTVFILIEHAIIQQNI